MRLIVLALFLSSTVYAFAVQPVEGDQPLVITDTNVNIRSDASTDSKVVGKFKFGDRVYGNVVVESQTQIGGAENYWYKVRLDDNNHFGFVWGEYVSWIILDWTKYNVDYLFVSNKLYKGRYGGNEFRLSDIGVMANGKIEKIKFTSTAREQIQGLTLFELNNGSSILMSHWFFADAEVFSQNYEIYDFDINSLQARELSYSGTPE